MSVCSSRDFLNSLPLNFKIDSLILYTHNIYYIFWSFLVIYTLSPRTRQININSVNRTQWPDNIHFFFWSIFIRRISSEKCYTAFRLNEHQQFCRHRWNWWITNQSTVNTIYELKWSTYTSIDEWVTKSVTDVSWYLHSKPSWSHFISNITFLPK